jgi:hypothetical protein
MAKVNVTAVKRVGRHKPGESFSVSASEKRALMALGFVREPDQVKAKSTVEVAPAASVAKVTRPYVRRDMVAAQPAPAVGSTYFTKGE